MDFGKHLYVPEEENGERVHQREDHNHLLKRIIGCMRECKILDFDTTYLKDALNDPGQSRGSREVIVGLVANLESREDRRIEYSNRFLSPEQPRTSSTDDVEGFFSLLHQMLGVHFDLKQFYDEFPRL
ncbi:hypothetical protein AC249_AIPGENE23572 [Exaiptasia diaphana]|nr:hypothetical protein AC249_AIPGENE23572 [Exaiptasia diaphana]